MIHWSPPVLQTFVVNGIETVTVLAVHMLDTTSNTLDCSSADCTRRIRFSLRIHASISPGMHSTLWVPTKPTSTPCAYEQHSLDSGWKVCSRCSSTPRVTHWQFANNQSWSSKPRISTHL